MPTIVGEVPDPGLGPLHTEFDGKGYAYTSVFISSEIVKWSLKDFKVVDRIPTYYSIGHLMIPGGDSGKPFGKYVLALNKITKDRYLPTGPELTQSAQLYAIDGDKMQLLLDFPTVASRTTRRRFRPRSSSTSRKSSSSSPRIGTPWRQGARRKSRWCARAARCTFT